PLYPRGDGLHDASLRQSATSGWPRWRWPRWRWPRWWWARRERAGAGRQLNRLTVMPTGPLDSLRARFSRSSAGIHIVWRTLGSSSMRSHCLSLLSLLVPVCFAGNALAQEAVSSGNWSDSAIWPGGQVPGAGAAVVIGQDMDVVLDVSPPPLRSLTIAGKLSFSNAADLEVTTEWISL